MALPFLPGNTFNHNLGKTKYHKSHHFDYNNSVGQDVGEIKPGIGGERRLNQKDAPKNSSIPKGDGPAVPSWVAFDKQVLLFEAYFMESVSEGSSEQYNVHQCRIFFYLEDDTMQICEPKQNNSGTMQGTLVRRQRVPKPAPREEHFYTVDDLNNGNELEIYGRVYKLVDCDQFTQNFLRKLGVKLNPALTTPSDPHMQHRTMLDNSMQPRRPYEHKDSMRNFLELDGKVLRFYCFWDDRANKFGDPREMVLLYHLADDTVEVVEILPQNSGRDATPMFLKKNKLPKVLEPMRRPGEIADRTVLNVFTSPSQGGRYLLDNLKLGEVKQDFYEASDLMIGNYVNVWGRPFLICDCDAFTKDYYRQNYGINDFTPLKINPAALGETKPARANVEVTPLVPRPPKKDFVKFMNNDTNTLRYLAKMANSNEDRLFVICFFLSDDTLQVFEKNPKNSGMIGGRFLERGKVKKGDDSNRSGAGFYVASDFYAGALVELNKQSFVIVDADEHTYNYMEENYNQFPQSDIRAILELIKSCGVESRALQSLNDVISLDDFFSLLNEVSSNRLTIQELVTVARYYQDREDDELNQDSLVSLIQNQLRKSAFDDFTALREQCYHFDVDRIGSISSDRFRLILMTLHAGVSNDILRTFLNKLKSTVGGNIQYDEVIHLLNYKVHRVSAPSTGSLKLDEQTWQGNKTKTQVQKINMRAFFNDVAA